MLRALECGRIGRVQKKDLSKMDVSTAGKIRSRGMPEDQLKGKVFSTIGAICIWVMTSDFLHQVIDNTAWARQIPFYALS